MIRPIDQRPWRREGEPDAEEGVRLAKRVEKWQGRLVSLGIAHWDIMRVIITDDMPSGPDTNASVQCKLRYDSCQFWFNSEYLQEATRQEVDQTIIHEWLHVAMRDFDTAIESAEENMGKAECEMWEDRILHEREALVEHMARQLYAAFKG